MAIPAQTPRQQGHFAGWSVGNSLSFNGHAPNPHLKVGHLRSIAQWDAGYWDGFQLGQQDHRDSMIDTGRAA